MAAAIVTPSVIRWARERAGFATDDLARKLGTSAEKVAEWEAGTSHPTFRQAEKFANATHVPFGFLFLPSPPDEDLPIPDLRTSVGAPPIDAEFRDALRDVLFKFDWYRDYRLEHGSEALPFVGRYKLPTDTVSVARDMAQTLGIGAAERIEAQSADDFLRILVAKAEHLGLWILRNGVVGNNTHRPLSVDVFRGFAISDPILPVIFINGADAKAAQIFTFAHELCHIWIGASGISDPLKVDRAASSQAAQIETFCNRVAAEFLVPEQEFRAAWDDALPMETNVEELTRRFRVSRIVVAIRAREIGIIDSTEFEKFFAEERRRWKKARDAQAGGGDYYRTAKARNGDTFLRAVVSSAMSGELLLRDAGTLLNMTPKSIREAYKRQQGGQL